MNAVLEMPMMAASNYASNTISGAAMLQEMQNRMNLGVAQGVVPPGVAQLGQQIYVPQVPAKQPAKALMSMAQTQRRLVQVFIADPDENVPLDQCLLYSGEQKLTDLTDQELFFEVDVKSILDAHNKKRVEIVNKSVKERTEHLEAARVRDLKMTVVTIAQF